MTAATGTAKRTHYKIYYDCLRNMRNGNYGDPDRHIQHTMNHFQPATFFFTRTRASKGGTTIAGVFYKGGQFLPAFEPLTRSN